MTEETIVQAGSEVTREKNTSGRQIWQLIYVGLFLVGLVLATLSNLGQKMELAVFFGVVGVTALVFFVISLRAADR